MKIHDFLKDAREVDRSLRQRDVRQALRDRAKRNVAVSDPRALVVEKAQLALREIDAGRLIDFAAAPITQDAASVATRLGQVGFLTPPLPLCCMLLTRGGESFPNLLLLEEDDVPARRYFTLFEATNEADEQGEFVGLKLQDHVRIAYFSNATFMAAGYGDAAACHDTVALAHTALALLADERTKIVRRSPSSSMSARKANDGKPPLSGFWKVDHTASAARLLHESAEDAAKHMTRAPSFFEAV